MTEQPKVRRVSTFWQLPDAEAKQLVKQAQSERDKARHAAATEILEQPTPPAEEIKSQRLALDPERPLPVYLTLARRLHERGGAALEIRRYVRQLGEVRCTELAAEAEQIHAGGGMMTDDGRRKRTLGGVFFKLCKHELHSRRAREEA